METNDLLELLSPGITTADKKFNFLKSELEKSGNLNLVLTNGHKISNIKAIAKWGTGLFYGFVKGQKNFTKSISINDVVFLKL